MIEARLTRLFDLVVRQLGAVDARVELGGRAPSDPRLLWCPLPSGWRLVAVFETPPDDPGSCLERLTALAEAFSDTANRSGPGPGTSSPALASRRLDDELYQLVMRCDAVRAVVIDDRSPVVWGSSEPRRAAEENVEAALDTARSFELATGAGVDLCELLDASPAELHPLLGSRGVTGEQAAALGRSVERIREGSRRRGGEAWRHHLLSARAIAKVRHRAPSPDPTPSLLVREADFGLVARAFANTYWLVLVFDQTFSELHADGAAIRALPVIERLVLALPPVEPPPRVGRVLQLRRS